MKEQEKNAKKNKRGSITPKTLIVVLAVGVILSIAAIIFGRSDTGGIDVSGVINESNRVAREAIEAGETPPTPVVDTRPRLPNGGLVPSGQTDPKPTLESKKDEATTTEDGATTTEDGTDEGSGDVEPEESGATTTEDHMQEDEQS